MQIKEFEVLRSSIHYNVKLGQGSFGTVWLGTFNKVQKVAVKELKPVGQPGSTPGQGPGYAPGHPRKSLKDCFIEEARNMSRLQNHKIVQLLGICVEIEPFLLITEYMVNGDLKSYLMRTGPEKVPYNVLIDMLSQV